MRATVEREAVPPPFPPLRRNREFMLLWSGAGASILGSRASMIAYPLLVLWQTGSASASGLVMAAALLPNLVVQLPAGVLVDRWNRRHLMIISDIGCVLVAASVAVSVLLGRVWIPQLMVAGFIGTSLSVIYLLAERGGVRNLVATEQLPAAMSRNETRGRVANLIGQPVGTLLFTVSRGFPFLFAVLAHLVSLAALLLIKKEFQVERVDRPRRLRVDLSDGIIWTWRQRVLRTVLMFIAATNVLFQGLTLGVLVIVEQSGRSPAFVGLVLAGGGAGGAIGAASAKWWRTRFDLRAVVVGAFVIWALLMPWVAVVRDPVMLGALFAVMSYVGGVLNVAGAVYQIRTTPDAMQGRVGSVMLLLTAGVTPLGALAAGFALDAFGVTGTAFVIGCVMVALAGLISMSSVVRSVPDYSLVAPLRRLVRASEPPQGNGASGR
jgi:predicted MFS family arabinose efflux permease